VTGLPGGLRGPGHQPIGEVADRVVHHHWELGVRRVAGHDQQVTAGQLGDPVRVLRGRYPVLIAGHHQHRTRQRAAKPDRFLLVLGPALGVGHGLAQHGVGVVCSPHSTRSS
jgi:hypothetical protein